MFSIFINMFFFKLKPLIDISGYHLLDVNTMHLFKRHSKRCLVLLGTKTDFQISQKIQNNFVLNN